MAYGVVYGLYDPRTGELRYIGQTTGKLDVRVRGHMREVNLRARRHASHWLRQLKDLGLRPTIKPLHEASSATALDELEVEIIRAARESGVSLTNTSMGGTGAGMRGRKGGVVSPSGKERISEAQSGKPKSEEHRKKLSNALIGKPIGPRSAETRARMSAAAIDRERKKREALNG
jgi:hypothetical protein